MEHVPKIWSDTLADHRDSVREAIIEAAAAQVAEHGLTGVSMSGIAQAGGIGRATLYKYFPDVASILAAWHDRQIVAHMAELMAAAARAEEADRLEVVLSAYARGSRRDREGHHGAAIAAALHASPQVHQARHALEHYISTLIAEAAERGEVRTDVPAGELAVFCVNALNGAGQLSKPAVERLVAVTLAGLRP
ncbi:transcriptional regulator, TetR family [Catenulispora acidiphila DSM 44928]|uniref:Transcriptional regulator, TetR family n=1 Tax=Catenulispora acidiphila (strain DSM 44928 / JCM 14897 / NBRC 102108 / NRRL B-24433 / ID139908) TaxID=479433 RepID=C7QDT2_CATAD|nr:transcriptional regulator, TetR family [Catenulispora acidiphila DSM 44928]